MRDTQPIMLEKRIFELEQNGGGGGTADYNELTNKPQIEGITLEGNTTFEQLGVASATDLAQTDDDLQDVADDLAQTMADVVDLNNNLKRFEGDLLFEATTLQKSGTLTLSKSIYDYDKVEFEIALSSSTSVATTRSIRAFDIISFTDERTSIYVGSVKISDNLYGYGITFNITTPTTLNITANQTYIILSAGETSRINNAGNAIVSIRGYKYN